DRLVREGQRATGGERDGELHVFLFGQLFAAFIVVHENEARVSVGPNAPAQRQAIVFSRRPHIREKSVHPRERRAERVQEKVESAQHLVLRTNLTVLTERGLEVVILNRHVVPVGDR